MKEWKLGLFSERSGWLSLPKYAGLFKINLAKAIFSTKPASWIKEASIVHPWKQSNFPSRVLYSLRWHSTLPHSTDIFSNYVINTVAGLISEIVRYNCIQPFISSPKHSIHCAQVRRGAKGYLFFGTQLRCQWLDWFLLDIADRTGFCNLPIITLALWYNKNKFLLSAKINQSGVCSFCSLPRGLPVWCVNNVQRSVLRLY